MPPKGLRVIELGQLIAGPFGAKMLADFGAEATKVEPPEGGDQLRKWRLLHDSMSVWWAAQSHNKRSLALDLRQAEAQDMVALYESVFAMMESLLPEYSHLGAVRQAVGSSLSEITPSNAYRCLHGRYALIAGNGNSTYKRLRVPSIWMTIPRLRPMTVVSLGSTLSMKQSAPGFQSVISRPCSRHFTRRAFTPARYMVDLAFKHGMLLTGQLLDGSPIKLPGIVPKRCSIPGRIHRPAPTLGSRRMKC